MLASSPTSSAVERGPFDRFLGAISGASLSEMGDDAGDDEFSKSERHTTFGGRLDAAADSLDSLFGSSSGDDNDDFGVEGGDDAGAMGSYNGVDGNNNSGDSSSANTTNNNNNEGRRFSRKRGLLKHVTRRMSATMSRN